MFSERSKNIQSKRSLNVFGNFSGYSDEGRRLFLKPWPYVISGPPLPSDHPNGRAILPGHTARFPSPRLSPCHGWRVYEKPSRLDTLPSIRRQRQPLSPCGSAVGNPAARVLSAVPTQYPADFISSSTAFDWDLLSFHATV